MTTPPEDVTDKLPEQHSRFIEAVQKLNVIWLWAALAGALTGLIGGLFRLLVGRIEQYRASLIESLNHTPVNSALLSIVLSAVMVYLGFWLMRRFAPDTGGSGIPQIEGALDGLLPFQWQRVLPVKFFAGLLVLGSGMVMGREGPTIQMGGSIGQMVGKGSRLSAEQISVLVAAGAGAGLTAAFNAPLAGITFVFEEMRPKFKNLLSASQVVTIACIMATIVLQGLMGSEPTLGLRVYDSPPLRSLWILAILGIFLGAIGYAFNLLLVSSLNFFAHLRGRSYRLVGLLVGGFVGLMAWLYAPITGGGEQTIIWSLDNRESEFILLLGFVLRFGMTLLCYGSGAPGGIFAPMLSIATIFSQAVARQTEQWFPTLLSEPGILAIAGMGAIVAATVRAPLTAIILTIEMTGNYNLILPLLITCLTATMMAQSLGGRPIYTVLLERMLARPIS